MKYVPLFKLDKFNSASEHNEAPRGLLKKWTLL
jgi:hypothetical protein